MLPLSLNHVTVKTMSFSSLLETARTLGCVGVELRNDLSIPLFDGTTAKLGGVIAANAGLRVFAVADCFNEYGCGLWRTGYCAYSSM